MASYVAAALHQVFFVVFLVTCLIAFSTVEARESSFLGKTNPVRRYSQLISSSMPALAPLPSKVTPPPVSAPTQAPVLSEIESDNNYVYGFYNREVGEFPMTTTKEEANAIKKKIHPDQDEFMNNDSGFGSQETDLHDKRRVNNYKNNRYADFQKRYRSNNNVQNYKYTRTNYDNNNNEDNMYTTNYKDDIEDDENDRYYNDEFERAKRRTFGRERYVDGNGRYYDDNGERYYRGNQRMRKYKNPMEEYEGVYQP